MPESFGARMREQRERQQVALSTIAEQTKIKVSLLEALERDDVSHWPSGIFRRAFIRAYAHAIGLEPDAVLREFLDIYPDPAEVSADALAGSGDDRANEVAPIRMKYLVASAIGSVTRLRRGANQKQDSGFETLTTIPDRVVYSDPLPVEESRIVEQQHPVVSAAASVIVAEEHTEPIVPVQTHPVPAAQAQPSTSAELLSPPRDAPDRDLMAVADLCTELGRVQTTSDVPPLLSEMAKVLDAIGVIVWMWDPIANELRPALTHGYSDRVVAQLPRVERDTNNATAAAFRAGRTCIVRGDEVDNGALAVPLIGPGGCVGVLAVELAERMEEKHSMRAHAMIFAAQLATLIGTAQPVEASDRRFA
jgi:transcriptional regulator with XRE-family HTH domain